LRINAEQLQRQVQLEGIRQRQVQLEGIRQYRTDHHEQGVTPAKFGPPERKEHTENKDKRDMRHPVHGCSLHLSFADLIVFSTLFTRPNNERSPIKPPVH
jgi:hypothetical protein